MKRLFISVLFGLAALPVLLPEAAWAQDTGTVAGTVTDAETGEPLPGASILIVELDQGGATGADGTYTIEGVTPGDYTIRASFVGYQEQEENIQVSVEAGETVTQDFELTPDYTDLEEVVVIGYGERSRRDVTGSVSSVSAEEIENIPTSSPEELLQGRTAGVQIEKASGLPGSAIQVDIRGGSSITGGTQPLFVIDGIPVRSRPSASDFGQSNNALASLDPASIQSVEVLKDASATAIYGSRASNGVVLITTKRGSDQPTAITAGYYAGAVTPTDDYDVLNGPEYATIYREAANNAIVDDGADPADYANPFDYFERAAIPAADTAATYQALDEAFRAGLTQQLNVSARGGNESTRFYLNGTYNQSEGFLIANNFQRINGQINLDHDINDWSRVGITSSVGRVLNDRASADNNISGVITSSILRPPISPLRDENGNFIFSNDYNIATNSVADAQVNQEEAYEWHVRGNAFAEVDPVENLTLRANGGLRFFTTDQYSLRDARTVDGNGVGVRAQDYFEERTYLIEGTADYTNTFANRHFLNIVGGASFERTERNQVFTSGQGVASENLFTVNTTAEPTTTISDVDRQERLVSYFSRANYTYDDRYILEGSFRVDGSSRFGANNRFGFFPAGAVAWRISSEQFMEQVEWVDELKLRVSYGITGNDQIDVNNDGIIDPFPALALFTGDDASYAETPGLIPSQLPSPDLRWEQAGQLDVGLDLGMFNQRIFLTADFYNKNTSDLIQSVQLPRSAGFNEYPLNIGSVRNRGVEFSVETQNLTGDFFWNTNFNAAYIDQEVTDLADQDDDGMGDPLANTPTDLFRVEEGRPLNSFYLIPYEGVDPETGAPIFTDTNGDGDITPADRQFVGNSQPDWTGGITNRLGYRGLELSFFFQFETGGQFYNSSKEFGAGLTTFNLHRGILDRWQEPGDQTDVPRLVFGNGNNAARESTRWLEDGDYLRLKDVTLGYSLPANLAARLGMQRARVYVKGQNLLTFTDVTFGDPESTTLDGGEVFYSPPQARSITAGVDFTF